MSKRDIARSDSARLDSDPGRALLRSWAGYPYLSIHLGKHRLESRVVIIDRDSKGKVVRSTERLEFSEHTDLDGDFVD